MIVRKSSSSYQLDSLILLSNQEFAFMCKWVSTKINVKTTIYVSISLSLYVSLCLCISTSIFCLYLSSICPFIYIFFIKSILGGIN